MSQSLLPAPPSTPLLTGGLYQPSVADFPSWQLGEVPSPVPFGSPGRHAAKRVRIRGRRWTVTFNDRLEYPPSDRWREEAENRRGRQEDVDRAHAAAQCSDQVAEEEECGMVQLPMLVLPDATSEQWVIEKGTFVIRPRSAQDFAAIATSPTM